jgi:hypothetical protein
MSKYGVNVPRGVAVSSVEETRKAIKEAFPNQNEVIHDSIDYNSPYHSLMLAE